MKVKRKEPSIITKNLDGFNNPAQLEFQLKNASSSGTGLCLAIGYLISACSLPASYKSNMLSRLIGFILLALPAVLKAS